MLHTPQTRFPVELVGEIIRATERKFPKRQNFKLRVSKTRGSDLTIPHTASMRDAMFAGNHWRGMMAASEPGCYVHYLPRHGPNLQDSTAMKNDINSTWSISGYLYPQWAIGFAATFVEKIAVEFKDKFVTAVHGESDDANTLREMMIGGKLIEGGGCGFNAKAPRYTIYPADFNSPCTLHFGIDLAKPSDFIRKVMPNCEEPPLHQDIVTFDTTVTAAENLVIDAGFLTALRDSAVVAAASAYGDAVDLFKGVFRPFSLYG